MVVDLKLKKSKPGRQFSRRNDSFTRVGMILQDAQATKIFTPVFGMFTVVAHQYGRENDVKWMRCLADPAMVLKRG